MLLPSPFLTHFTNTSPQVLSVAHNSITVVSYALGHKDILTHLACARNPFTYLLLNPGLYLILEGILPWAFAFKTRLREVERDHGIEESRFVIEE